jgi:hypothetical protein
MERPVSKTHLTSKLTQIQGLGKLLLRQVQVLIVEWRLEENELS